MQIPVRATYRIQLNRDCGFNRVRTALAYLAALGVSHLYLSPIFQSRSGSPHGYDVTNHTTINPEIGTYEDLTALATEARARNIGLILDIVPNHMAVMADDNAWWLDVLENGPAAEHASYFDIDWSPVRTSMRNRLLVPVLGAPYGELLETGELRLEFAAATGSFSVRYHEHRFPLDPREYPLIFAGATPDVYVPPDHPDRQDFESLLEAFRLLPGRDELEPERRTVRYRDKEVHKRRLARLCERSSGIAAHIDGVLRSINGVPGDARSYDALARVLDAQPYRLAHWRVAGDEINYRRFFDVDQLAALRVEDEQVFVETHRLVCELMRDGVIDGVRIDHADGLHDPKSYFERLQHALTDGSGDRVPYVVAEKILASHERLPDDWPVHGSTGYEFGSLVTQWLTFDAAEDELNRIYRQYTGQYPDNYRSYDEIVHEAKKLVMNTSLAAEVTVLAIQLDRIAQADRYTADFTFRSLRDAIVEVIANFPVYRTYISVRGVRSEDRQTLLRAINTARGGSHGGDRSVYAFLQAVLLGELPGDDARRAAALQFAMKFQQVTGPVMAKSVEDTAFYRYNRLLSANEVGGDPGRLGVSTAILHQANRERAMRWPYSMLASSTHDTKRSEDVRYRLCALAEHTDLWSAALRRWKRLNRRSANAGAALASRSDEYRLFQTLLGIWPASAEETPPVAVIATLRERVREYAIKAAREAKELTSWIDPDPEYEAGLAVLVDQLLGDPSNCRYMRYFHDLLQPLARAGVLNALSAVTLKVTAPGVPDFYQGTELPALTLVDPDNRGLVDCDSHAARMAALDARLVDSGVIDFVAELMTNAENGEIKLFVTARLLQFRSRHAELHERGEYLPLSVTGAHADHLCAYARHTEDAAMMVVVTRWHSRLLGRGCPWPTADGAWQDTHVEIPEGLPAGRYRDVLTDEVLEVSTGAIQAVALLSMLPIAVLVRDPRGENAELA